MPPIGTLCLAVLALLDAGQVGERLWTQREQWHVTGCASQIDLFKTTPYLQMGNFRHMTYLLTASISLSEKQQK